MGIKAFQVGRPKEFLRGLFFRNSSGNVAPVILPIEKQTPVCFRRRQISKPFRARSSALKFRRLLPERKLVMNSGPLSRTNRLTGENLSSIQREVMCTLPRTNILKCIRRQSRGETEVRRNDGERTPSVQWLANRRDSGMEQARV